MPLLAIVIDRVRKNTLLLTGIFIWKEPKFNRELLRVLRLLQVSE